MKLSRSRTTTVFLVVLATCTGILLSGCATTGDSKEAAEAVEAAPEVEEPSAARQEPSGSSPEARPEPVVETDKPAEKARVQKAGYAAQQQKPKQAARNPDRGPEQTLGEILRRADWNRIVPPVGAVVAMALIWGFGFWLARLPLRRRAGARRQAVRQTGAPTAGLVPGEPAFRTG